MARLRGDALEIDVGSLLSRLHLKVVAKRGCRIIAPHELLTRLKERR